MQIIYTLVMIAIGLFCIICSVKEVPWFFNNRKAGFLVKLFGMTFAKIFYIIIGVLFIIAGIIVAAGVITIS